MGKRVQAFDVADGSRGYVDYVGNEGGFTHHTIEFTVHEFNGRGNTRRSVKIRLDLYDAAKVAGLFQKAMAAREDHSRRLQSIASGSGY